MNLSRNVVFLMKPGDPSKGLQVKAVFLTVPISRKMIFVGAPSKEPNSMPPLEYAMMTKLEHLVGEAVRDGNAVSYRRTLDVLPAP